MNALFYAIHAYPPNTFWAVVGLFLIFSFYFLYQAYKNILNARMMEDTPTAKIRSAAQGYVELQGVQHFSKQPLRAPLSQLSCTWYRYAIECYQNERWRIIEEGMSEAPFELEDGTGRCVIQPKGAQIIAPCDKWSGFRRKPNGKPKTWIGRLFGALGRYRYHEWRMSEGMSLYAIGYFQTIDHINTLSQTHLTNRTPFILSAKNQKQVSRDARLQAFFWFIAYVALLAGTGWVVAIRLG